MACSLCEFAFHFSFIFSFPWIALFFSVCPVDSFLGALNIMNSTGSSR